MRYLSTEATLKQFKGPHTINWTMTYSNVHLFYGRKVPPGLFFSLC